jgi:hypothetical protein
MREQGIGRAEANNGISLRDHKHLLVEHEVSDIRSSLPSSSSSCFSRLISGGIRPPYLPRALLCLPQRKRDLLFAECDLFTETPPSGQDG